MALVPFRGIPFSNPGYLCYCNATINGFLASKIISSSITPHHCACCDILESKKNDYSFGQSSELLREVVAQKNPQFNSSRQQDPSEFMTCIIKGCNILSGLTKSEIISSYKCSNCSDFSDDADSEGRFKNILDLNITGSSIAEIVLNARKNTESDWKRCLFCNKVNNHKKKQNWLILPSVLIINLHRFQDSKFTQVEPSLELDGVKYALRAVITHHGKCISRGHITASLYQGNDRMP